MVSYLSPLLSDGWLRLRLYAEFISPSWDIWCQIWQFSTIWLCFDHWHHSVWLCLCMSILRLHRVRLCDFASEMFLWLTVCGGPTAEMVGWSDYPSYERLSSRGRVFTLYFYPFSVWFISKGVTISNTFFIVFQCTLTLLLPFSLFSQVVLTFVLVMMVSKVDFSLYMCMRDLFLP